MIHEAWPIIRAFLPLIAIAIGIFSFVWLVLTAWEHYQAWRAKKKFEENFNPEDFTA